MCVQCVHGANMDCSDPVEVRIHGPFSPCYMAKNSVKTLDNTAQTSACDQTRKWHLKLTLVRVQTWSLTALGEDIKSLCIKDHVRSSINDFCERI